MAVNATVGATAVQATAPTMYVPVHPPQPAIVHAHVRRTLPASTGPAVPPVRPATGHAVHLAPSASMVHAVQPVRSATGPAVHLAPFASMALAHILVLAMPIALLVCLPAAQTSMVFMLIVKVSPQAYPVAAIPVVQQGRSAPMLGNAKLRARVSATLITAGLDLPDFAGHALSTLSGTTGLIAPVDSTCAWRRDAPSTCLR